MVEDFYLIDNILSTEELIWLYHYILDCPNWTLTRSSVNDGIGRLGFTSFPGLSVQTESNIEVDYLAGYFHSLVFRIKKVFNKNYSIKLPSTIKRIHIGAKSSYSKTFNHVDSSNPLDWTILGFLNPVWNSDDGGELIINKKTIDYKPGRFIVFKSNKNHNGGFVKKDNLNYWRISCNIMLSK